MKTIRSHVFETNSSSCHALAVFHADEWESLTAGDSYVMNPYSLDGKILSLSEAREAIIDYMEDEKTAETEEALKVAYEKLREDDALFRELMEDPDKDGQLLGSDLEGAFQDAWTDSYILSYEEAYGTDADIWEDEGETSFIFQKDDIIIVSGSIPG